MKTLLGKTFSILRRAMLGALALLVAAVMISVINAALTRSRQVATASDVKVEPPGLIPSDAAGRLAQALRFKTISAEGKPPEQAEFQGLHTFLTEAFPSVHGALKRETVADFSLLYTWAGSDPSLKPILLLAHMDVVPVEASTEARWQHPPFAGAIEGGYVWGRGALDDKGSVVAILEAVELLLRAGYKPRRTIYLGFGHDEEAIGGRGALGIAQTLRGRGVRLEYVLDEGLAITVGIMPALTAPLALIGLAEKGYLSLALTVEGTGGHSSMPPPQTAAGVLSAAVARLESQPLDPVLRGPTRKLFEYIGPDMPALPRLVFTNIWLLRPLLVWQLGQTPSTNALIRTTTAATMLEASPKDNVLPQRARAVFNFRTLPGDTSDRIVERVRRRIADPRVHVAPLPGAISEASPESSDASPAFTQIARSIRETFPGTMVAPSLVLGATDGRHFATISDDVYRFAPTLLQAEDLDRLHGLNERIAVSNYGDAVRFYWQLIHNSDAAR